MTTPSTLAATLVAATTALLAGCGGSDARPVGAPASAPAPTATATAGSAEDCPEVTGADGSAAMIDYVDFVQAFGRQYIAGLSKTRPAVSRGDLGRVVLRSKCSFSALNDRTQKSPGDPADGDTAFLPPGTPIYTVRGRPAACVLAAEQGGRLQVYLAYRDDTDVATPRRCATRHWGEVE